MMSVRHFWFRSVVALLLFSGAAGAFAANERDAVSAALASITAPELQQLVDVLASDDLSGREAGSQGGRAAAAYLVDLAEQAGVSGAASDGVFFQSFGNGYRNILFKIDGSDPQRQKQVILIGAHYDHVGYGSRGNSYGPIGYVHNGADDNASGVAVLVEVMQAFLSLPEAPRRSILFACWDGEELGLLGSKHWLDHPSVALEDVVLAFNLDMVGRLRDDNVEVYGTRTAPGLRSRVARQNQPPALRLDFIWDVNRNGDHYNFFQRRIPFLMFHTGLHENYHRPSDDANLINAEGMRRIAQLLMRTALDAANADQLSPFRDACRSETNRSRSAFERVYPAKPARLGLSWEKGDDAGGLKVTGVQHGSAAEKAGIRVGDRVVEFLGRPITAGVEFRLRILRASSPIQLTIVRPGGAEPMPFTVHLDGSPVRLGISWKADQADPSVAILSRVTAGSAAALAGLAPKDRVYAVSGQPFSGTAELRDLIARLDSPMDFLIERRGILRNISVSLLDDLPSAAVPSSMAPATQ